MANPTTQVSEVLARQLRRNARALAIAIPKAGRGHVRAIHRARVATRRLRESLPIAAGAVTWEGDRVARGLRRVTRTLGEVRELDVTRKRLSELAEEEAWPAAVVARIDADCEERRARALEDVSDFLGRSRTRPAVDLAAVRRLADALESSRSRAAIVASVSARVRERARALALVIAEAGTVYSASPLHEVRVATKKLRYVIEVAGEDVAGSLRMLRRLQTTLGRLHDLQVLQERVQALAARAGDRRLVANLDRIDGRLEALCREGHARVLRQLPLVGQMARSISRKISGTVSPRGLGRPARMKPASIGREAKSA